MKNDCKRLTSRLWCTRLAELLENWLLVVHFRVLHEAQVRVSWWLLQFRQRLPVQGQMCLQGMRQGHGRLLLHHEMMKVCKRTLLAQKNEKNARCFYWLVTDSFAELALTAFYFLDSQPMDQSRACCISMTFSNWSRFHLTFVIHIIFLHSHTQ